MKNVDLNLTPEEYFTPTLLVAAAARHTGLATTDISHVEVIRRSLDSRRGIRGCLMLQ